MSTYTISKRLCEIFNTEFDQTQLPSDQELESVPDDATYNKQWQFTNKGGTISEDHKLSISHKMKGRSAWNKGIHNPLASSNGKKGADALSKVATGRKRSYYPDGSWTWVYPENR